MHSVSCCSVLRSPSGISISSIAGVCAGLGRRFGLSSGVVRLLFVISCLLPGPQILIYLVLWALMPSE